jgi:uncharacterized repeat protein (TIGR01451 family)
LNSEVSETEIVAGTYYFDYDVDLPAPITFVGGTKYWISIQGVGSYYDYGQWGWAYHPDPILLHMGVFKGDWFSIFDWEDTIDIFGEAVDFCFQLTGPLPEPVEIVKLVWDGNYWVDYAQLPECTTTQYYIGVHNNGDGPIWVEDIGDLLPPCVEYMDNAIISFPGTGGFIPYIPDVEMPPYLEWNNGGMGWMLLPCEWIDIIFDVHVIGPICIENWNWASVTGILEYYPYGPFYYEDYAIIHPIPEGVVEVTLEKEVWCEPNGAWGDEVNASFCQNVPFRITITNTGTVTVEDIYVYDYMEGSLEYVAGTCTVDGIPYEPDYIWVDPLTGDTDLSWYLGYDLAPGETLIIEFEAHVIGEVGSTDYNFAIADFWDPINMQYEYTNEDYAMVHIIKCKVCADANGPYQTDASQGFQVTLDGSGSFPGSGCHALTYLWEIPTVGTFTGVAPVVTFTDPCPERTHVSFQVKLTVTCALNPLCVDTDFSTVTVYGECAGDPPLVQWIYPTGGETLSGTVDLQWFAHDDHDPFLDIYLYADAMKIAGPIANTGSYSWSSNSVSDGTYDFKVEARNSLAWINHDSCTATVDNGYAGVKVSNVQVTDTSTGSTSYVKDGDTVRITADITGGQILTKFDIDADLSGFGKGTFYADTYNGYTATWTLSDVTCDPTDGPLTVTVRASGDTNFATVTADNTAPEVTIVKPDTGLYLRNMKLLPLAKTVIIGPITIELDAVDANGITAEFYVDDDLKATVTEAPYTWELNLRLLGQHTLKTIVFDGAGNTATAEQLVTIWNLFGN